MKLKDMQVKKDESVSRQTVVSGETVRMFNVSKNDKTGHNYKVNWTFDFSDVSHDELLKMAAQSAVIAYRKNFRGVAEDVIPNFAERTIDVKKDILTHTKRGKSDLEKAKDILDKLSDAEKAAILDQLK